MRVLVVDDERAVLSFVGPLLEREGFTATLVDSGMAAVASVVDSRPDLVLLDVNLPDLSGPRCAGRSAASRATSR